MLNKKNPMSVFYDGYIERNPLKWMQRFGRQWKWAYQRATKGYADCDLRSIRDWFLSLMPEMLEDMSNNLRGYPVTPSEGKHPSTQTLDLSSPEDKDEGSLEWQKTLKLMAKKFRDADETKSSFKNKYEEEWSKAYDEFHQKYGMFGQKLEIKAVKEEKKGIPVHFPDEFPQWKDIMEKFREEEVKVTEKRVKSFEAGLEMFRRWFWDLWD